MEENIDNVRQLLTLIDKEINGLEFNSSDRYRVSIALFDIVLEHANSIIILFGNKLCASPRALARPLFEGFIRACWILNCASDNDVNYFIKKDKLKLSFDKMVKDVKENKNWSTFSQAKKDIWNAMHSYTHGGMFQISRRIKASSIEPIINEEEIEELIYFASLVAFLSFSEIIGISKVTNEEEKNEILKKFEMVRELMESINEQYFNKSKSK